MNINLRHYAARSRVSPVSRSGTLLSVSQTRWGRHPFHVAVFPSVSALLRAVKHSRRPTSLYQGPDPRLQQGPRSRHPHRRTAIDAIRWSTKHRAWPSMRSMLTLPKAVVRIANTRPAEAKPYRELAAFSCDGTCGSRLSFSSFGTRGPRSPLRVRRAVTAMVVDRHRVRLIAPVQNEHERPPRLAADAGDCYRPALRHHRCLPCVGEDHAVRRFEALAAAYDVPRFRSRVPMARTVRAIDLEPTIATFGQSSPIVWGRGLPDHRGANRHYRRRAARAAREAELKVQDRLGAFDSLARKRPSRMAGSTHSNPRPTA